MILQIKEYRILYRDYTNVLWFMDNMQKQWKRIRPEKQLILSVKFVFKTILYPLFLEK